MEQNQNLISYQLDASDENHEDIEQSDYVDDISITWEINTLSYTLTVMICSATLNWFVILYLKRQLRLLYFASLINNFTQEEKRRIQFYFALIISNLLCSFMQSIFTIPTSLIEELLRGMIWLIRFQKSINFKLFRDRALA